MGPPMAMPIQSKNGKAPITAICCQSMSHFALCKIIGPWQFKTVKIQTGVYLKQHIPHHWNLRQSPPAVA